MTTTGTIIAIAALLLGVAIGYLLARQQRTTRAAAEEGRVVTEARLEAQTARAEASRAREEAAASRERVALEEVEKAELRTAAAVAERRAADSLAQLAEARAAAAAALAQRDAATALVDELKAGRAEMADQFRLLSEQSLDAQGAKTQKVADDRMAATQLLVTPLAESLRQLGERLGEVEKQRVGLAAELREQVQAVKDSGEAIRKEASSLSTALRTPNVRGAWGEQSLRRIVEISGLVARCDFDDQTSYSADGDRFRPDMRINLADGKVVFVDSKVPLKAVLDAYNTEDQEQQRAHLATFARHVRGHIDDLSGKNYWQLEAGSPEFVVLFLGSDEFYRLAQEQQPDLHEYAARLNVMLACPGTLIPLLHIVAHGWKQAALAESAADISKLGRELYDRLATLGDHFDKLGRSLTSTVGNFNKAVGALESRVMVSARRFRDLAVTQQELPPLSPVDTTSRLIGVPEMLEHRARHLSAIEAAPAPGPDDASLEPTGTGGR